MEWIFLNASGVVALLNKSDNLHQRAKQIYVTLQPPRYHFLTTDLVLTEAGNSLSHPRFKQAINRYILNLQHSPNVKIVYTQQQEFNAGLERYVGYIDQEWGLTDCISFEIMQQYACHQALTNDHHFQQAGFTILIP